MAHAPLGAQSGLALHHGRQQLVGVQRPLHQHLGAATAHQRDGLLGCVVAVLGIDDFVRGDVELRSLGGAQDLATRPDQDRRDDPQPRRIDGAGERELAARMRHRGGGGRQTLDPFNQALVSRCASWNS